MQLKRSNETKYIQWEFGGEGTKMFHDDPYKSS